MAQNRTEYELVCAQHGVIGDEINTIIPKIVSAIPSVMAETMADLSDEEKAYRYAETYFAQMNSGASQTPTTQQTPSNVTEGNMTAIPAADMEKLTAFQNSTQKERQERTQKTSIPQVIGDKPYPGEYFTDGMTMVPTTTESKMEEYRGLLLDTAENKAAFEAALEAVKGKKAVKIYVPSQEKWSPRLIGLKLSTPSKQGDQQEEITMDMSKSLAYIAVELAGFVANTASTVGATLAMVKSRKKSQAGASAGSYEPRLKVVNRKKAFGDPNMHQFASRIKRNGNNVVTKEGTVRSEMSFKVKAKKTNSAGEPTYRTVRLTGTAQVPVYERVSADMERIFGSGEANRDIVSVPVTDKARQSLQDAVSRTQFLIMRNSKQYGDLGESLEQKLKEVVPAGGGASNPDDNLDV